MSLVTYYIDGIDLNTYGVYISSSDGLLSRPKMKTPVSVNWPTYHGEVVDLSKRYYESREIELECFIKADSKEDFISKLNTFLQVFDQSGTRRLMVVVDVTKPLVYEVYLSDELKVTKKWSDSTMVGTFTLKLIEMQPIKKVVKFVATDTTKTLSITLTTSKLVNAYWGDANVSYDISGTSQTVTHTYTSNGTYYTIIAGNIDEITSLTTTGTVIWNKL